MSLERLPQRLTVVQQAVFVLSGVILAQLLADGPDAAVHHTARLATLLDLG